MVEKDQERNISKPSSASSSPDAEGQPKMKTCIVCGERIPKIAKKCVHCDSFQNWQRFFGISSIVLSLLVALLSVGSIAIPTIMKAITPKQSDLAVSYLSSEFNSITILICNSGVRPGVVAEAELVLEGQSHPLKLPRGPILIEPEKSDIVEIRADAVTSYFNTALDIPSDASSHPSVSSICQVRVHALQFNGAKKTFTITRPCTELLHQENK